MKILKNTALALSGLLLSLSALAADPLDNTLWQTYEDGKPKATVKITQVGDAFTGVITAGNTEKAKGFIGQTVITGLKAAGNGKYEGGEITDPVNKKTYKLSATLNGDTLKLRGYLGVKALGRTQTWKKK